MTLLILGEPLVDVNGLWPMVINSSINTSTIQVSITPQISGGQIPDTKQHDIQARPLHLDVRWLMLMAEAHHLKCHPKLSIA